MSRLTFGIELRSGVRRRMFARFALSDRRSSLLDLSSQNADMSVPSWSTIVRGAGKLSFIGISRIFADLRSAEGAGWSYSDQKDM